MLYAPYNIHRHASASPHDRLTIPFAQLAPILQPSANAERTHAQTTNTTASNKIAHNFASTALPGIVHAARAH